MAFFKRPSTAFLIVLARAVCLCAVAYLFGSGPVMRWCPAVGEAIYAPLSRMADNQFAGPVLRGWLQMWGVDVGE
jgi:hypothetical protein